MCGEKGPRGRVSDWTGVAVKSLASIVNSVEYIILYSGTRSLSALVLQWASGVTSALWCGGGMEDDAIGRIYYGFGVHADLACNISERRAGRVLYIIYDNIIAYAKCNNIIFRSESKSTALRYRKKNNK